MSGPINWIYAGFVEPLLDTFRYAEPESKHLGGEKKPNECFFLYFAAYDSTGIPNLWETDGTASGTHQVKVVGESPSGLFGSNFVTLGQNVLFTGLDSSGKANLFEIGGTSGAVSEIQVAGSGPKGLGASLTALVGNFAVFTGHDSADNLWFYRSDGTAAGTTKITPVPGTT